jgi:hypothetical protein
MDKLYEYLKSPKNSLVREALVKNKLFYDSKLYFASQGRSVLAYESEYDRDGFDVIFDELGTQRHFQIKSVLKLSSTAKFNIHRMLLRPNINELNYYPLSHDSFGAGYGGAVILVELSPDKDELDVDYYYTDGLILCAFHAGVLEYKYSPSRKSVIKSFNEFQHPHKIGGQIILRVCAKIKLHDDAIFEHNMKCAQPSFSS